MTTPTRKRKYEEVRWSLSHSSLAVCCAGVSAFRFPIVSVLGLVAITTMHCTIHHHMSVTWRGSVGTCATYLYHMNGTDTVDRSVGRSVDAHVPVDHTSVGLAHARPNYLHTTTNPNLPRSVILPKSIHCTVY